MTISLKRTASLIFLFILLAQQSFSQKCATTYRDSLAILDNPNYLEQRQKWIQHVTSSDYKSKKADQHTIVYIPTVVHVIHTSAEGIISNDPNIGNISEPQIMSQIEVLNNDYRRKFGTPGFNDDPVGADLEIQFCLAKLDPNGNPTDGITRHYRPKDEYDPSADDRELKEIVHWPENEYLNIYVVPSLTNNFLGYASFPDEPREYDGVVMSNRYFGNRTGTSIDIYAFPYNQGRTLTHEIGHWLGLVHIWGDGNCGFDDGCEDTPDSDAGNYGCDTTHISCNTLDMVRNYMDYSDDDCFNIFTQCQKMVARSVFDESNPTDRSSFLISSLTGSINCDFNGDTTNSNKVGLDIAVATIDQKLGRYIIINLEPGTFYGLEVYNLQGKRISSEMYRTNAFGELQFNLIGERRGLYILRLKLTDGDTREFKIYGPID